MITTPIDRLGNFDGIINYYNQCHLTTLMKNNQLLHRNRSELGSSEHMLSSSTFNERHNNTSFSFSEMSVGKYCHALTLRIKMASIYGSILSQKITSLLYNILLKFRKFKQKYKSKYTDLAKQKVVVSVDNAEVLEICTQTGLSISIVNGAQLDSEKVIIKNTKVTSESVKEFQLEMRKDLIYLNAENNNVRIRADNIEMEATKNMRLAAGENMTINGSIVKVNC